MINYNGYSTSTAGQPYQNYYAPTVTAPVYTQPPTYTAPAPSTYTTPIQPAYDDYFGLISNEADARACYVPGKHRIALLDLGANNLYFKTYDMSGIPQSFEVYKLVKDNTPEQSQTTAPARNNGQPQKQYNSDPITRGELNKILNERFQKFQSNQNNGNTAKETK